MLADTPLRPGYIEGQAGWSSLSGVWVGAEAGYRLTDWLGVFGTAKWTPGEVTTATGFKVTF